MQDPKTQEIKGKYFKFAGEEGYKLSSIIEDFDMIIGSILKLAPPKTYKKPKKGTIKIFCLYISSTNRVRFKFNNG
jgi:hypothetical protein